LEINKITRLALEIVHQKPQANLVAMSPALLSLFLFLYRGLLGARASKNGGGGLNFNAQQD